MNELQATLKATQRTMLMLSDTKNWAVGGA